MSMVLLWQEELRASQTVMEYSGRELDITMALNGVRYAGRHFHRQSRHGFPFMTEASIAVDALRKRNPSAPAGRNAGRTTP